MLHISLENVQICKAKMKNIAIFASGSGSNAENIINYFSGSQEVSVALIVCNKADAFVFERAKKLGVPARLVTKAQMQDEASVMALLKEFKIDFIVLAGYLLLVPKYLVEAFPRAIVNIHPALIPLHCGKGMYGDRVHEDVIKSGDRQSGITIHYVNEFFDNGDIIFQATCPVEPGDDAHAVATKVHALEYAHFPRVIAETIAKM
jgi:phosphoribosylglycinamide formyltransferase-1